MVVNTEGISDHFRRNTSRGIELTQHHLICMCSVTLLLSLSIYVLSAGTLHCEFWAWTFGIALLGFELGREVENYDYGNERSYGCSSGNGDCIEHCFDDRSADGECSVETPCRDENNCCSQLGFCGTGPPYCGNGCHAGPCTGGTAPSAPAGGGGLGDILTKNLYEKFFPGHLPFYSYDKLIEASKRFPQLGTTGDTNKRKREIAEFAAHVKHETSGLKKVVEQTNDPYCDTKRPEFPCNGKHFNGRGPLQLSWNFNYGPCGNYLKTNLLGNPDLVATDSLVSFKSSLWFWNQYGDNVIPHMHDVITRNWKPSNADEAANRVPGFGVTIDIINGGLECGKQSDQADNRVKYFKDFCNQLNVSPGDNLDCKKMKPFSS